MSYRLINEKNPAVILGLTGPTWYGLLDLAEVHGWNPMGTVEPEWWLEGHGGVAGFELDLPISANGYTHDDRLVMLEDALNLAEALERAFLEYEPERRWETDSPEDSLADFFRTFYWYKPSIGAITAAAEFCRSGSFYIERF